MRQRPRLFWMVFVAIASVLIGACVTSTLPKAAKKDRGLLMNHKIHADQSLDCSTCHESKDGVMSIAPHETCSACHEINVDAPTKEMCGKCHKREDYSVDKLESRFKPEVKWSHDPHIAKEVKCETCHGADPDANALPAGPLMTTCMNCHAQTSPKLNACEVCHTTITNKTKPQFRGTTRIQHDVPAIWAHTHGNESRIDPKFCITCHTERQFCDDCHSKTQPDSHTPTWRRKAHGIEASFNRNNCTVCHEEDSCLKCHRNTQPESHKGAWGPPVDNHCTTCHFPATKNNCTVCHESVEHQTAPPSPHRALVYPPNCMRCHPGGSAGRAPHAVNTTASCKLCH